MADGVLSPILRMVDKLRLWVQAARRVLPSSPQQVVPPSLVLQVQDDLEALHRMLRRIQAVLNDAEKREILDEAVKLWLSELKGVAYEADDVIGEYEYELLRAEVEAKAQDGRAAQTPHKGKRQEDPASINLDASLWNRIAGKIEKIRCRFEEISVQRDALHLREEDGVRQGHERTKREPTSYLVDESGIFGREDDCRKVIDQLLSSEGSKEGHLLVLPIVGMGGVGKTTLAQLVYNDPQVRSHFQLMGWVCVSDDFEVHTLNRRIIESLDKKACILIELSSMQEELTKIVQGKRFLLVLDDLWSAKPWESLKLPLKWGSEGSVVIATTRNESVARIMQTTPFYHLGYLSDDNCWSIFRQNAFHGQDHYDDEDLQVIGRKIAIKCKGLPLAARVLGGLLHDEYDLERWEDVLQSDIWNIVDDGIIPALRLSYLHLPSYLKQCFVYSAAFPKDFRFEKDKLVLLWMAQGFLQCGSTKDAEDTGIRYFEELANRSFFQRVPENPALFVMHDLIHDLAQYISGGEYFQMERGKLGSLPQGLRHLSFYDPRHEDIGVTLEWLSYPATKAIRTLLVLQQSWFMWMDLSVRMKLRNEVFLHVEFLRALNLSGLKIGELPDSIGNLKHLRYLNLECTDIKALPESVCKLYHLQSLILQGCESLRSLPKDMKNLRNLRFLRVKKEQTADGVTGMPRGIGRLTSLRTLDVLNVGGGDEDCGVQELEGLAHLRGRLEIMNLQNVLNAENARLADLKSKRNIKDLLLCWAGDSGSSSSPASPDVQTRVLEFLRPHKYLMTLGMYEYGGRAFPSWMAEDPSPFVRLVQIFIGWCPNCSALPPLGLLPSLKLVKIWGADAVQAVGAEFRGCGAGVAFPVLETLEFHHMAACVAWQGVQRGDFPRLQRLHVLSCPNLESIVPLYNLPALQALDVCNCKRMASLDFWDARPPPPSSPSTPPSGPPPLKEIHISRCPRLCFSQEDQQLLPSTLRDLRITSDCPALVEWCRGDAGRRLAGIPNAKFWRDRGRRCFVSTSRPEVRNGEVQVDHIPVIDDVSDDEGGALL